MKSTNLLFGLIIVFGLGTACHTSPTKTEVKETNLSQVDRLRVHCKKVFGEKTLLRVVRPKKDHQSQTRSDSYESWQSGSFRLAKFEKLETYPRTKREKRETQSILVERHQKLVKQAKCKNGLLLTKVDVKTKLGSISWECSKELWFTGID